MIEKIKFGEIVEIEDGKEYICYCQFQEGDNDYVFLVSNFKPVEVRFAKQEIRNNQLQFDFVSDQQEKLHLLEVFQQKFNNDSEISKLLNQM